MLSLRVTMALVVKRLWDHLFFLHPYFVYVYTSWAWAEMYDNVFRT